LAVASPGLAEQGKEVGHMVEYMVMQRKVEKLKFSFYRMKYEKKRNENLLIHSVAF